VNIPLNGPLISNLTSLMYLSYLVKQTDGQTNRWMDAIVLPPMQTHW